MCDIGPHTRDGHLRVAETFARRYERVFYVEAKIILMKFSVRSDTSDYFSAQKVGHSPLPPIPLQTLIIQSPCFVLCGSVVEACT